MATGSKPRRKGRAHARRTAVPPYRRTALRFLAHARSGDKGNTANVGLIALEPAYYPLLVKEVTPARVARHFKGMVSRVERFELPNLGALNFPVALSIAIVKATLVILFFMHVKYSSRLTKLVAGGAFFFLVILFGLTMTDYLSRAWFASPRGTAAAGTQIRIGPPEEQAEAPAETAPGSAPVNLPEQTPGVAPQ